MPSVTRPSYAESSSEEDSDTNRLSSQRIAQGRKRARRSRYTDASLPQHFADTNPLTTGALGTARVAIDGADRESWALDWSVRDVEGLNARSAATVSLYTLEGPRPRAVLVLYRADALNWHRGTTISTNVLLGPRFCSIPRLLMHPSIDPSDSAELVDIAGPDLKDDRDIKANFRHVQLKEALSPVPVLNLIALERRFQTRSSFEWRHWYEPYVGSALTAIQVAGNQFIFSRLGDENGHGSRVGVVTDSTDLEASEDTQEGLGSPAPRPKRRSRFVPRKLNRNGPFLFKNASDNASLQLDTVFHGGHIYLGNRTRSSFSLHRVFPESLKTGPYLSVSYSDLAMRGLSDFSMCPTMLRGLLVDRQGVLNMYDAGESQLGIFRLRPARPDYNGLVRVSQRNINEGLLLFEDQIQLHDLRSPSAQTTLLTSAVLDKRGARIRSGAEFYRTLFTSMQEEPNVGSNRRDHLHVFSTTKDIVWADERMPGRPITRFNHMRCGKGGLGVDGSLQLLRIPSADDNVYRCLLHSRLHPLLEMYTFDASGRLLLSPYTLSGPCDTYEEERPLVPGISDLPWVRSGIDIVASGGSVRLYESGLKGDVYGRHFNGISSKADEDMSSATHKLRRGASQKSKEVNGEFHGTPRSAEHAENTRAYKPYEDNDLKDNEIMIRDKRTPKTDVDASHRVDFRKLYPKLFGPDPKGGRGGSMRFKKTLATKRSLKKMNADERMPSGRSSGAVGVTTPHTSAFALFPNGSTPQTSVDATPQLSADDITASESSEDTTVTEDTDDSSSGSESESDVSNSAEEDKSQNREQGLPFQMPPEDVDISKEARKSLPSVFTALELYLWLTKRGRSDKREEEAPIQGSGTVPSLLENGQPNGSRGTEMGATSCKQFMETLLLQNVNMEHQDDMYRASALVKKIISEPIDQVWTWTLPRCDLTILHGARSTETDFSSSLQYLQDTYYGRDLSTDIHTARIIREAELRVAFETVLSGTVLSFEPTLIRAKRDRMSTRSGATALLSEWRIGTDPSEYVWTDVYEAGRVRHIPEPRRSSRKSATDHFKLGVFSQSSLENPSLPPLSQGKPAFTQQDPSMPPATQTAAGPSSSQHNSFIPASSQSFGFTSQSFKDKGIKRKKSNRSSGF